MHIGIYSVSTLKDINYLDVRYFYVLKKYIFDTSKVCPRAISLRFTRCINFNWVELKVLLQEKWFKVFGKSKLYLFII